MLSLKNKKIFIPVILLSVVLIVLCLVLGSSVIIGQRSNGPVSTEKQAIKIALPLAQACAKENNFSITTTEVTFIESTNSYWFVEFELKTKEDQSSIKNTPVMIPLNPNELKTEENTKSSIKRCAYEVAVWADTGKIYHHGPIQIAIGPKESADSNEENVKISLDKAIETALPLAQTYAQENNRIITTITSECYLGSRPCWDFNILFEAIKTDKGEPLSLQYWIRGYQVSIWADTGEIRNHNVMGVY